MKKFLYLFLLSISSCFYSCKDYWTLPQDHYLMIGGIQIGNFPKWACGSKASCYGYSSLLDWEGEQGQKLHKYVDNSIIPKDFEGKFRLFINSQEVIIDFNDKDKTMKIIFTNYLWKKKHYTDKYDYPQTDIEHSFIYNCYAKQDLYKEATEQDKSHVEMTLVSSNQTNNLYRYKQEICGELVIDVELKNNIQPNDFLIRD